MLNYKPLIISIFVLMGIFFIKDLIAQAIIISSPEDAIAHALRNNPEIREQQWVIMSYQALKRKTDLAAYPSLQVVSFIAPVHSIEVNANDVNDFSRDYGKWGPVFNVQGLVVQPVYTFGRLEAGKQAALWGIEVAVAEKRQKANQIQSNIYKYYWGYQLSLALQEIASEAKNTLGEIIDRAQQSYDSGNGEVSVSDLAKLRLFYNEVLRQENTVEKSKELAFFALKREMGLPEKTEIEIPERKMEILDYPLETVEFYINFAKKNRPELEKARAGVEAYTSLARLKEAEVYPIIAVAGKVDGSYSPVRPYIDNPLIEDPYTHINGGVGLAFTWHFDSGQTKEEAKKARYAAAQIATKEEFAQQAIPLETRKAYLDLVDSRKNMALTKNDLKNAKSWATSAKLGYDTGTQSAKDLIEGLGAYMKTRADYYTRLYDVYLNTAELGRCIGQHTIFVRHKKPNQRDIP